MYVNASLESMAVLEKIFRVQESYFRVHRVLKFQKKHPGCIGCPRSSAFGTSLVLKNIFFRKDPGAITLCGVTN